MAKRTNKKGNLKGKAKSSAHKKVVKPAERKKKVAKKSSAKFRLTPLKIAGIVFAVLILILIFAPNLFNQLGLFPDKSKSSADLQPFPAYNSESPHGDEVVFEDFVGSETCASCHSEIYNQWKESTHGKAGGDPNPNTVIGAFDGKERSFKDGSFTATRTNGKYVFKVKADGLPDESYQVDALVGGGHMIGGGTQTYFSRYPDGTLRFLPFDYIRDEKVWFGETNTKEGWVPIDKNLSMNDLSEWPPNRVLGAHLAFQNCQECHGSQIQIKFDEEEKKYDTKFVSLSINCESCHGPGKDHVELALSGKIDTSLDIGMQSLAILGKDESLNVCFRCHALKDGLETGFLPGKDLEDHYALKFPMMDGNPYHVDGRIKAFGYQQNHLFSDCYLSGSMTCVDCHDPHTQDYRDINGKALAAWFDDGQCTSCHPSKELDPVAHTHHLPDSPGSQCVSCHMPFLQHQAMGDHLRFARSDHTIPIPRPEFDEQLGIENACKKCHQEKSTAELQATTEAWYGKIKPHNPTVAKLHQAVKGMELSAAGKLLLDGSTVHYIGQMAGLSQFAMTYLSPDMEALNPEVVEKIKAFAESDDLDLQSMALASLHLSQDHVPEVHNYLANKLDNLNEKERKVRARWATALPIMGQKFHEQGRYDDAINTYKKALEIKPDKAGIYTNLGFAYEGKQDYSNAISSYKKALELSPSDATIHVNLGNAYKAIEDMDAAIKAYREAINVNPWNHLAYFNLGNYFYQTEQLNLAIGAYQKTVELEPSLSLGYFYLSRTYIKAKDYENALSSVKAGLRFDPDDEAGKQMLQDLQQYFGISD